MKPPARVIAALVEARHNHGRGKLAGPSGKGIFDAVRLGLMEAVDDGFAELNLRGQDIADEAIHLAKFPKEKRR